MEFLKLFMGQDSAKYQFSVEIAGSVISRITDSVTSSDIEEGGKLLGTVMQRGSHVHFNVETYLDSGPRVSNSETHLVPDGEHQEYLFRIVEGYNPKIEHIGSWHSHHCNGYPDLSTGDIQSYTYNVNHQDYNLNWFFVLLVTQVVGIRFQAKYYAFHRADQNYYQIQEDRIRIVEKVHLYDNLLKEAERATLLHRKQVYKENRIEIESSLLERELLSIRAEDKAWFNQKFPFARVVRNNRDNSISWKWSLPINKETVELTYTYPTLLKEGLGKANFKIKFRQRQEANYALELDKSRFGKIEEYTEEITKRLSENSRA